MEGVVGRAFTNEHTEHIVFLIENDKEYMIRKGGGDYETGFDEWLEDPFGNQEPDMFSKSFDDGPGLLRLYIERCLSKCKDTGLWSGADKILRLVELFYCTIVQFENKGGG